jgi:hypothetical protein
LRATDFREVNATPVAILDQNGELQTQPTQGEFTVGLVTRPDANVVVTVPPSFGPITAGAGWTPAAFLSPQVQLSDVRPVSSNWLTSFDVVDSVFESLGKELQMASASLQPQEGIVKMASQAANDVGTQLVRMQASRVDQPSGRRAAQQDVEINEIRFVAEAGIDWFLIAAAMTLPSQAPRREDTERLLVQWTRSKNGAQ